MIVPDNKLPTMNDTNELDRDRDRELPPPYAGTGTGTGARDSGTAAAPSTSGVPLADSSSSSSVAVASDRTDDLPPLPPRPSAPQKPASNFVIVKRENSSINDSYVIDTQLRVPEGLFSPAPPDAAAAAGGSGSADDVYEEGLISGERPHIYLQARHSSVNANIWLVRGRGGAGAGLGQQDAKSDADKPIADDRALVNVKSSHGSVTTKLYCETEQPYILCCSSKYGSVSVWIPSTFAGPATFTTTYGKVVLSPAVQERCTTFSEINNVRTCFLGDYGAAGFRSLNEWKGSILQLSTSHSKISVGFVDELSSSRDGSGFSWSKIFSWK